jgi:hypothetical protein
MKAIAVSVQLEVEPWNSVFPGSLTVTGTGVEFELVKTIAAGQTTIGEPAHAGFGDAVGDDVGDDDADDDGTGVGVAVGGGVVKGMTSDCVRSPGDSPASVIDVPETNSPAYESAIACEGADATAMM